MNYCNLNCEMESLQDVTFYKFLLDKLSVKCFIDKNSLYFNISDLIEEVEESIKNLFLDKYKKIIVQSSEYSGVYVEHDTFITILSWIRQDLYKEYKKFLFFVNLYFTLKNMAECK